jgi:RNA polymerase sigma-70 factor, ECF subfamily
MKETNLSEQQSDQDLVRLSLANSSSYKLIIDKYRQPLLRYIFRLGCSGQEDAEDVLQETFIKVYLYLNDYDPQMKFSSWLYRIAHNETMNFFRKAKIRPQAAQSEAEVTLMERVSGKENIVEDVGKGIEAETIRRVIETLDSKYRDVLILKYMEDKSYEEISDILKKPSGTVATLLNRAKSVLKKELLKYDIN